MSLEEAKSARTSRYDGLEHVEQLRRHGLNSGV